jgi:stress response protein YsnF
MLVEHEIDMREERLNIEKAYIAKSKSKVSKHRYRSSNSDSDKGNVINCYLCDENHAF